MNVSITPRRVRHVRIESDRPYADLRADYERLVPSFDRLEAIGVVLSQSGWPAITRLSDKTAPHGLASFFTFDPSPVMALNDNQGHGTTYLSGNIIKAERAFAIDPATFLYLPLRVMLSEAPDGRGVISFDLPQDLFTAFDDPRLAQVATDFAETFAEILELLGLPVPEQLHA
jgi:hypothetical protein